MNDLKTLNHVNEDDTIPHKYVHKFQCTSTSTTDNDGNIKY